MVMRRGILALFVLAMGSVCCHSIAAQPGAVSCTSGAFQSLRDSQLGAGFVPAAAVTRVLPAGGNAGMVFYHRLDTQKPQTYRVFQTDDAPNVAVINTVRELRVISVQPAPKDLIKDFVNGYSPLDSVLLGVDIDKEAFPLWGRRSFIVLECSGDAFVAWGQIWAPVSSPYVSLLCLPVALATYLLAMQAVYISRRSDRNEKLEEKYPAIFGAKVLTRADFFNPIHLTANAFNQGSVQKLQVLLFSFLVGCMVLSLVLRTGALANLSETVVALLGISGIGAAAAQMTYTQKTRLSFKNWAWLEMKRILAKPEASGPKWRDLVLTNREFDVYKLQTIVFSVAVAVALITGGAANLATFEIPSALLGILGLSQVVFIGGILVRPPAIADLDKALDSLRDAADTAAEAVARKTDTDEEGKLLPAGSATAPPGVNATRQYRMLAESVVPMIESALEVDVNKDRLMQAPFCDHNAELHMEASGTQA